MIRAGEILVMLLAMVRGFIMMDLAPLLTAPLGWLRRRHRIAVVWPAEPVPLGKDVALLSHFERRGQLRETTRQLAVSLADAGFSVVLVSNAGRLQPSAMAALQDVCAAVVIRANSGYDFGAWADAMHRLGLPREETSRLLLVNDSVYGPLAPLPPLFAAMEASGGDIWSLTDSWQKRYHLQSYFMLAYPAAFRSEAWRKFWRSVRPLVGKHAVIRSYEVGLSQRMLRAGLRCRAVFGYRSVLARQLADASEARVGPRMRQARRVRLAAALRQPLNPTSDLWRALLQMGFPFIKRELLRDNPGRVQDLVDWQRVVAEHLRANTLVIEADLAKTLRNKAP